jgi:putative ABC transport system substrate-binding protein
VIHGRDFVCRLAAGVLLAPLAAHSQTATKKRRIGFLSPGQPPTDAEAAAWSAQLRALGWIEGRNFAFENRFVGSDVALLRSFAEELVRLKVDMIVTLGTETALAAKNATTTIPIVMASIGDPVGTGLVASLAHPGGNITGYSLLTPEIETKRAALLTSCCRRRNVSR